MRPYFFIKIGIIGAEEVWELDLQIFGRNMEITNETRQHVEGKLEHIERHLPGISVATVELVDEATRSKTDQILAQVTLHVGRTLLRAKHRAANAKSAVNLAVQALDHQIKRYKSHAYRNERGRLARRRTMRKEEIGYQRRCAGLTISKRSWTMSR